MEITKEELVELIKSTFLTMKSETSETVVQNSEPVKEEEEKEEEVEVKEECENACSKEDEDDKKVKNEEPETEVVEETCEAVEEKKDEEEKKEEVIKFEALNSAPTPGLGDDVKGSTAWKNLHGKEFFDWVNKHRNEI